MDTGEDDLGAYDPTDVLDELSRYLDGGVETDKTCPDALQWWKVKSIFLKITMQNLSH